MTSIIQEALRTAKHLGSGRRHNFLRPRRASRPDGQYSGGEGSPQIVVRHKSSTGFHSHFMALLGRRIVSLFQA